MKSKRLLILLLMALLVPWAANAQNTLTVCDGTETNQNVPVFGYYADTEETTSEFILPSTTEGLSSLIGKEISGLTFYLSSPAAEGWGATFQVYLKEVDYTTQTNSWTHVSNCTVVYTGELDGSGETMSIQFDNGYTYQGGNLLIGTVVTEGGEWDRAYFYGVEATEGASIYVYDYYGSYYGGPQSFLPKTTFSYSSYQSPTNLSVNGITTTTATIGWTAPNTNVTGYQYQYKPEGGDWTSLTSTTATSAQLSNLTVGTNYSFQVKAMYSGGESSFASTTFNTRCVGIDLPFAYGFEDEALSVCWNVINTNTSYNAVYIDDEEPYGGDSHLLLRRWTSAGVQIVVLPEVDEAYALNGYEVSFYAKLYDDNGSNSYGVGRTLTVGVMTDPSDMSTFEPIGEPIEPTTEYKPYTVQLFSYTGSGKFIAIKHVSTTYGYTFVDNLEVNELPTCLPPTELAARNITTNSANLSWLANTNETEWTLYWKKASAETYTEVTGVTDNPYPLSGLEAGTNYKFYVVANCAVGDESDPSAVYTFATECEVLTPTSSSPYVQNFDGYVVPDYVYYSTLYTEDRFMPNCWSVIDTTHYDGNSIIYPTMWNYSNSNYFNSSPNCFYFYLNSSQNQQGQFAILPQMNDVNTLRIRLNAATFSSYYSGDFIFGVMTDPTDARTFTQVGDTIKPTSSYENYTVNFASYEGNGQYIAIKLFANGTSYKYLYIDDVVVDPIPSCLEPANIEATATGYIATITWESDAESFDVAYATSATANPEENIVQTGITTASYTTGALALGDYYVWVRANCGKDGYSPWPDPVSVHIGYCVPAPTSVDGKGITNVTFGVGENIVNNNTHPSASPYYGDYSAQIGAVQAGVQATVDITYNTCSGYCYNYGTIIWIDLNNNLSFEDNEIVFAGQSSPDSNPDGAHTLNATFTIPATQTMGDYRMRIGGADSYFDYFISGTATADHDPCYSGSYTIFEDYTLRVLEAPDCLPAGNVTVAPESIGTTTAVISWTNNNGDEATYTVMQGETVLTTTAVDSYTLTELTAATTYPAGTFTIIPDCDETAIVNVPAFATHCETIVVDADNPFTEDFEGTAFPPICWDAPTVEYYDSYYDEYYTTSWTVDSYTNHTEDGSNSAYSYYYGGDDGLYLVMPDIQLSSEGGSAQLTFWSYYTSLSYYDYGGRSSVVLLDGDSEDELWTPDVDELEDYTWYETTIDLTAYMGQTITLAFKYEGDDAHAWYIDDVEVSVIPAPASVTQTLELSAGWNWVSFYVTNDDPEEMMLMLQEALGEHGLTIKSIDDYTTYDEGWGDSGDLEEIYNNQMYAIEVSEDCTVELQGMLVNTEEITIEIAPGWNWIGFPCNQVLSIEDALSNFEAEDGDQIKGIEEYSGYDGGWGDSGDLEELTPGQGYKYYNASDEDKELVFSTGAKAKRVGRGSSAAKSLKVQAVGANPKDLRNPMTVSQKPSIKKPKTIVKQIEK